MKILRLTLLVTLLLLWGATPVYVRAAYESEDARPMPIEELHDQIQEIEEAMEDAKQWSVPPNRPADVQKDPVLLPMMTADEILNSVIPLETQEKEMDLEFEEASLESILRTIGDITQINIVLDPSLKSVNSSLHLKKVKIRDALHIVANSFNLVFKKIGNSLFITTKERIRGENLVTRVFTLRYTKAPGVKAMTKNILDTITFNEDNNSLVVTGSPEEVTAIEEMIKKIDLPQPQVILEAKIIEINKDALKDLGVDWSDAITTSFQEKGRPTTFSSPETSGDSPLKIFGLARTPMQFNAIIKILENDNKAKVLSNPRIITLNNQQSEIFVGDRIPYTVTSISGGVATSDVRFVEPGIRLRVTPSIIDKDFVVLKIEPEVSFIFTFLGPQAQYPWVKTRNATAYVRIQNNCPFVLGGLLNQQDTKNLYKVPFLGDVPGLGRLFSYQKHQVTDSELIITVVPVIINQ